MLCILALTITEAKAPVVCFLLLAVGGCIYAGIAWFLARQHLNSFASYLPFATGAKIPAGARYWRNQGYVGAALFLVGCALAALSQRFF